MKVFLLAFVIPVLLILMISCHPSEPAAMACACDTTKVKSQLLSKASPNYSPEEFYALSKDASRSLWFEEVSRIDSTRCTRYWDAYHQNSFYAQHSEFKKYFITQPGSDLAFQIGPVDPLWSYHTFVLQQVDCCHVFIRATYSHARFRFKAYSFLPEHQRDSLYALVEALPQAGRYRKDQPVLAATFIDNNAEYVFDLHLTRMVTDFRDDYREVPTDSSIVRLIDFLDRDIDWVRTY